MIQKVLLASIFTVFLYNFLVFGAVPGLGLTLFLIFSNIYLFFVRTGTRNNIQLGVFASVVSCIFAILFVVRANSVVQTINILGALFSALTAGYLYKSETIFPYSTQVFLYPFQLIGSALQSIAGIFQVSRSLQQGNPRSKSIMRGLFAAIPIVIILLFILTNADPIFNKFIKDIFSNLGERTVLSIIVFISFILLGVAQIKRKSFDTLQSSKDNSDSSTEMTVIISSIVLVFACFIAVQLRYLFANVGERELLSLGVSSATYSEYVRKGFFELLMASAISGGILLLSIRSLGNSHVEMKRGLQTSATILAVETLVILLSAARRLGFYADDHGLTRARIFGIVFLCWMTVILAFFIMKLVNKIPTKQFFIALVLSTIFAVFSVSLWNIDRLVAVTFRPTVNSEIDYYYIAGLSPDAVDSWESAIEDAEKTILELEDKEVLSAEDNRKLFWAMNSLQKLSSEMGWLKAVYGKSEKSYSWKSYNFSERKAYTLISQNENMFNETLALLTRIQALQEKVSQEEKQNTQLDRSTEAPLSD